MVRRQHYYLSEDKKMSGKKKGIFKEFKEFITKGNVLDMAVGIIIGGAFTAIVNSLVADILNPFINTIFGGFSFDSMNLTVKFPWITWLNDFFGAGIEYPVFCFGNFISAVITFLITALALFLLIKGINALRNATKKKQEEGKEEPTTKMCPYCRSEIDIQATRCPHCTSEL